MAATTTTTTKTKAVIILMPESIRGTQWHQTGPGGRGGHAKADWLPTPPLSAESLLATPHRRKRRRISEEDEEEKVVSAKKHVSFAQEVSAAAEDAVPNTAQQKGRKRRRTLDVGDAEEEDKERPSKVRVTTARPSSIWLQRLRARPRRQLVDDATIVATRRLG
ncbi:hypothetical protein BR93DRAFT_972654 [Coniochaeta sp. PMI_546]|nr:hypothetical protein BR93DRAFT_972654 [Coniochaeta sp. PMI_546]